MEKLKTVIPEKKYSWLASDLMESLGYKSYKNFNHLVEKAVKTMILIEIPYRKNIVPIKNVLNGKSIEDFELSRFACYLIVMFADHKKEKVVEAQDRFTRKAEQYGIHLKDFLELERLQIRDEISSASKWLSSRATKADVSNYSAFNDAGYQGMYGTSSGQLHNRRNLPKEISHQEFMGRTELAANLLRFTLTEQTIWTRKINGQLNLEKVHKEVGIGIRNLLKNNLGISPENFPLYRDLATLKKQLKEGYLKMIATENI